MIFEKLKLVKLHVAGSLHIMSRNGQTNRLKVRNDHRTA